MFLGLLLFMLCLAAAPFVAIAAIVYACRRNLTEKPIRLLD
jgi:hypothetical protein